MIEKMSKTQDCRGKPMYKIYLNHKTMLSYCLDAERMLREKKKQKSKKLKTGNHAVQCMQCAIKKIFSKEQQANGLLSQLGIRTSLSNIPVLTDVLYLL